MLIQKVYRPRILTVKKPQTYSIWEKDVYKNPKKELVYAVASPPPPPPPPSGNGPNDNLYSRKLLDFINKTVLKVNNESVNMNCNLIKKSLNQYPANLSINNKLYN